MDKTLSLPYETIVKVNGVIGVVIDGNRFWDKATRTYSASRLPIITEYEETTIDEKIQFLKDHFVWGEILSHDIINDGEYLIFKYQSNIAADESRIMYYGTMNFSDTGQSAYTLDEVLVSMIARKHEGLNHKADEYFFKMLNQ